LTNLQAHLKSNDKRITKITVADLFGFKIVNINDLMYLAADNNYTVLHLVNGQSIMATKNLGEFEKMIDNEMFYRIHKSILVNVNYLVGFSTHEGNFADLKDGTRLDISRRKMLEFKEWIKTYSAPVD
jgi:two-component system, LytTR family, response regulator